MIKVQHIETDPLAPDTIEEVLGALERIIELTGRTLGLESYQKAKDYLHQNPSQDLVLDDPQLQSKYGGKVVKAASGYKEYRKIAKYFAVKSLITYCKLMNYLSLSREIMGKIASLPLYTAWENIGGQIIPQKQVELLFEEIKNENCRVGKTSTVFTTSAKKTIAPGRPATVYMFWSGYTAEP